MSTFTCKICGKVGIKTKNVIDFKPDVKELTKSGKTGFTKFVRSIKSSLDGKNLFSSAVWSHWITNMIFTRNIKKGSHILDLGAGSCELEFIIKKEKPDTKMMVLDLAKSGMEELAEQYKDVIAMRDDVCDCIHVGKPQFDVIILSHVLEHNVRERSLKLLDNALKVLKTGGKVLICAENGTGKHEMHPDGKYHFYFFGYEEMKGLLEERGIRITKEYGIRMKVSESDNILTGAYKEVFDSLLDMGVPSGWLVNLFSMPYVQDCRDMILIGVKS